MSVWRSIFYCIQRAKNTDISIVIRCFHSIGLGGAKDIVQEISDTVDCHDMGDLEFLIDHHPDWSAFLVMSLWNDSLLCLDINSVVFYPSCGENCFAFYISKDWDGQQIESGKVHGGLRGLADIIIDKDKEKSND